MKMRDADPPIVRSSIRRWPRWLSLLLIFVASTVVTLGPVAAQEEGSVQELTGTIDAGEVILYRLADLQKGQRLYVYGQATSGNLDPLVGVVKAETDPDALESAYEAALDRTIAEGVDPLVAAENVRDEFLLAWDDDGGGGLTAAMEFEVPADGDYRLLIAGALSHLGGQTFGGYRLLVGLDAPGVLKGDAAPPGASTDDAIAVLDEEATPPGAGVQEISGTLTVDRRTTFVVLNRMRAGDTLYIHLEATSGDLIPVLELVNFARKPMRSGNLDGHDTVASVQYAFPVEGENYRLGISSCCGEEQITSGDYRLLVGVNAPEVLSGKAVPGGRVVVRDPVKVEIGTRVEQIVEVDHQSEFFTAVASLQMEWIDPALAFNPETCQCDFKTLSGAGLDAFLGERPWPVFTLRNQQGNRWVQNRNLVVYANGRAIYLERFTTNFQVDFDFRKYPFDVQEFVIRVDSLYPEELFRYAALEGFTEISPEHGEDEFVLTDFETTVGSEKRSGGATTSRFTFSFQAPRHLSYYVWRVFVPILLIISVSWVTFFLRDYGRRIEVASANLLLFIAFSWSLAENYPRLGYLTFLDVVMAIMFVVNAFVVAYNVWLKRLEMAGQEDLAERVDSVLDWVYPLTYVASFGAVILWFFVLS